MLPKNCTYKGAVNLYYFLRLHLCHLLDFFNRQLHAWRGWPPPLKAINTVNKIFNKLRFSWDMHLDKIPTIKCWDIDHPFLHLVAHWLNSPNFFCGSIPTELNILSIIWFACFVTKPWYYKFCCWVCLIYLYSQCQNTKFRKCLHVLFSNYLHLQGKLRKKCSMDQLTYIFHTLC